MNSMVFATDVRDRQESMKEMRSQRFSEVPMPVQTHTVCQSGVRDGQSVWLRQNGETVELFCGLDDGFINAIISLALCALIFPSASISPSASEVIAHRKIMDQGISKLFNAYNMAYHLKQTRNGCISCAQYREDGE
jgi:hypothetical protein